MMTKSYIRQRFDILWEVWGGVLDQEPNPWLMAFCTIYSFLPGPLPKIILGGIVFLKAGFYDSSKQEILWTKRFLTSAVVGYGVALACAFLIGLFP